MARPEIVTIHLCRNAPHDLDIKPVTIPLGGEETLESAIENGSRFLKSYFNDSRRRGSEKPTQALLVGEDGRIIARLRMAPDGVHVATQEDAN